MLFFISELNAALDVDSIFSIEEDVVGEKPPYTVTITMKDDNATEFEFETPNASRAAQLSRDMNEAASNHKR